MDNSKRFVRLDRQQFDDIGFDTVEILKDTKTGVLYVYRRNCSSGGLTVLVDQNGKPLTSY